MRDLTQMKSLPTDSDLLQLSPRIEAALKDGGPVVALESTIIAHGLPYPDNVACSDRLSSLIEENGAVPALIALGQGKIHVGVEGDVLETLANGSEPVAKASPRDFGSILASGGWGATTVAGTVRAASMAGIHVFATGAIGGVHRGADSSFDISADLQALAANPVAVVSAGAKSILDLPKTLETLETNGVPVWGFKTHEFPAFYTRHSGLPLEHHFDDEALLAKAIKHHLACNRSTGAVIANPIPEADALDANYERNLIDTATKVAMEAGIKGKDTTPFVLGWLHENSDGRTVKANLALVENNAVLAAKVARALAA